MPLQQHSSSTQTGLAILVLIIIIGAGGWFALKPAYGNYGQAKVQLDETRNRLEDREKVLSNMDSLIADYENNEQRIKVLESSLPKELETPQILATMESLALQNGLFLGAITINDARTENLATPQAIPPQENQGVENRRTLNTAEVNVSLTGSHESFTALLSALERNLRLFDVQLLSVSPGETGGLEFNLQFSVYYQ